MRDLGRRIACIIVPELPLAAILRSRPDLVGLPVAVINGNGTHATVAHCTPEAIAGGVRPGLGAARAKQRLTDLKAVQPSEDAERSANAALIEVAFAFSPRVEDAGAGEVYLDLGDMSAIYDGEAMVATSMDTAMRRIGLPCRIGLGSCKTVARIAAQATDGVQVVPPGTEEKYLAPLPIRVLEPPPEIASRLDAWGIRSLGRFSALATDGVARRLGAEGVRLQKLAAGEDELPFFPTLPDLVYEEAVSFDDYSICNLEPLLHITSEVVERLLTRLKGQGLAARGLTIGLNLDPHGNDVRHHEFAAPLADLKAVMELLRLEFNSKPPTSPIRAIRIVGLPGTPQAIQGHLFEPPDPTPERMAVTLARLQALVGEANVGLPSRPQRRQLSAVAHTSAGTIVIRKQTDKKRKPRQPRKKPKLGLAIMRPPEMVQVERMGAMPTAVIIGDRRFSVRRAAGPWDLFEAWWTNEATDLECYDLELHDGRLIRVSYEPKADQWRWEASYGS